MSGSGLAMLGRWLVLGLLGLASCSVLGRGDPVSPSLNGRLEGLEHGASTLELRVSSRDARGLFSQLELDLGRDGSFHFEPILLDVAGEDFGRRYRAELTLREPARGARVLWRAEWSREAIGEPIELVCVLSRSSEDGQPCEVERATSHAWLVDLGEREFRRSCASCHGVGAMGDGPVAEALSASPLDLTNIAARHEGRFSRVAVHRFIDGRTPVTAHGSREMPVWGARLSRTIDRFATSEEMASARIDAIVTYLESLQDPFDPAHATP